jgi:hypothetical protein
MLGHRREAVRERVPTERELAPGVGRRFPMPSIALEDRLVGLDWEVGGHREACRRNADAAHFCHCATFS